MSSRLASIAAALLTLLVQLPVANGAEGIPVIVTEARLAPFEDRVEALGTLLAYEAVTLSTTVTETVAAIHFDDGDRVEAGQLLVELRDTEERALLEEARVLAAEAERQYERLKTLQRQGQAALSLVDERQREWDAAQARLRSLEARLADRSLRAPFSGVLGLRNISVGALVVPGDIITTLDDDRVMKLEFSVPATFLAALRPGLRIVASSPALVGRAFEGTVATVDSRVDPVTRSIRVRAHIPNPQRVLRPGMLMEVALSKNPRHGVRLPEEALLQLGNQHYVLLIEEDRALRREVSIGARRPGEVEIREGLNPGDSVVVHGTTRVSNGDGVRIVAVDDGSVPIAELLRSLGP